MQVRDKGVWLSSHKDVSKYRTNAIVPSMFPSGRSYTGTTDNNHRMELGEECENNGNGNSEESKDTFLPTEDSRIQADELNEEVSEFPLERCMRILPHDQNGGAFFIAVIHKRAPLPGVFILFYSSNLFCSILSRSSRKLSVRFAKLMVLNSLYVFYHAAIQEKPKCLLENDLCSSKSEPHLETQNQVTEDANDLEIIPTEGTDEKFSEAASEADLIDNNPDGAADLIENDLGGAALEPESSTACKEHNVEGAQVPGDGETDQKKAGGKRKLQIQGKWRGVDPVVFFKDEAIISSIKTFYGIKDSFPLSGHLVTRNLDNNHVKRIYYISKSVKNVLELNFSVGQQLKITSIGLKMFVSISIH